MSKINVAILGGTGAVGQEMLKVLAERKFPVGDLRLLADPNDAGKRVTWLDQEYAVELATPDSFEGVQLTLGAAPNPVSRMFTPEAVKRGSVVVDNSSAYRLEPSVPLVVPEVNPEDVRWHKGIVANPNCSTIIAMVPLKPLHDYARIRRLVVSTYQSVSGGGMPGILELQEQTRQHLNHENLTSPKVFQHQIAFNVIPHIDIFCDNGYTKEEMKMLNEGRKILHAPDLQVSCTSVRVPVIRSHSEAITVDFEREISPGKARQLLEGAPGVKVIDDPAHNAYPMPIDSANQDLVYVGRIRKDISAQNSLVFWCSGDQIRKGAATNAIQIAELLREYGLI